MSCSTSNTRHKRSSPHSGRPCHRHALCFIDSKFVCTTATASSAAPRRDLMSQGQSWLQQCISCTTSSQSTLSLALTSFYRPCIFPERGASLHEQPSTSYSSWSPRSHWPARHRTATLRTQAATLSHRLEASTPLRLFDTIEAAVAALAAGELVVVIDNEDRENEGDLIMSGDRVTPQAMAFMVEHTTGIICAAMCGTDLDRLQLPLMVPSQENEEALSTAFTVTVDGQHNVTTGVSASDRSNTLRALADPASMPHDLRRPGHIFPLRCREGGVMFRQGHTEAAVQLVEMAGCRECPVGVLSEIVDRRDGSMARTPYLLEFARMHGLKIITIADLVQYLRTSGQTRLQSGSDRLQNGRIHATNDSKPLQA